MQKKTEKKSAKKKNGQERSRLKENDIVDLILEDHKPLKQLIKIMKDSDVKLNKALEAFAEFAPLLVNHAKSEEQSLYVFMKKMQDEEHQVHAFEGDVEHTLADQLLEEIPRTEDDNECRAKIKVLAELVEHHIEEEEEEILPSFRGDTEAEDRARLGDKFLRFKTLMNEQGNDDSPSEGHTEIYTAN